MCILFVYREPNAVENSYRLVVASNRDEAYKRPAKPAHFWDKHPDCLGGTDNEPGREGGTWLGVSTTGRAGIILNLTGVTRPANDPGLGRGCLVVDYVTSDISAENYLSGLHEINQKSHPYNPYNLVLLDMYNASVDYLTSSPNTSGPKKYLGDILGVGNSLIEQPYAKVQAGSDELRKIVNGAKVSDRDRLIEDLRGLLKSEKRHLPDPELQRRSPDMYETLSSIYVNNERIGYGTRTHTILLVDGSNNITFFEETRMPDGTWKTQLFENTLKRE